MGSTFDADEISTRGVEGIVDDSHVLGIAYLNGSLSVAIDQIVENLLIRIGLDANRVVGNPIVLDCPFEIDARGTSFDQVGTIQVGTAQNAHACHANGIVMDVLALHQTR